MRIYFDQFGGGKRSKHEEELRPNDGQQCEEEFKFAASCFTPLWQLNTTGLPSVSTFTVLKFVYPPSPELSDN